MAKSLQNTKQRTHANDVTVQGTTKSKERVQGTIEVDIANIRYTHAFIYPAFGREPDGSRRQFKDTIKEIMSGQLDPNDLCRTSGFKVAKYKNVYLTRGNRRLYPRRKCTCRVS